jgi:hypothetical protein
MAAPITTFELRRASGWPAGMHVVPLERGELLIHSPTTIDDDTLARIDAMGTPRILFAPNHFHHLGLGRYRVRFPDSIVAASSGAIPRLRSRGHQGIRPLEDVALPAGMRWLVPEGTKSGEAWLAIDGEGGPTWIVCDAFFNEPSPVRGLEGTFLRLGKISPGLCLGATFKLLCLRDSAQYGAWVLAALDREKPRRLLFSHGEPLEGDAPTKLAAVIRARLG